MTTHANTNEAESLVWKKLNEKIEMDPDFSKELQSLQYFYERKLLNLANQEKQQKHIMNGFEDAFLSQYFQGYFVMYTILNDDDTTLDDDTWSIEIGRARNEIPKFLERTFLEEKFDWSFTDISHNFGIELLNQTPAAYDIFKKIRNEVSTYGAYKAFIEDERYKPFSVEEELVLTHLGNPFDLEFLSPQIFMQATYSTSTHEVWDLFNWSAVSENSWMGSLHLSTMIIEDATQYLLEIKLMNTIAEFEKVELISSILVRLPDSIQSALQTRVFHIEDIEVLQYSPENSN